MMKATLALGLRSTPQSLGVIGRALGAFAEQGVDLSIVREETAGPEGIRGLLAGEYDFAEFGAVPVVQAALEGHDPLILLAAEPVSALYVLGRKEIPEPSKLAGGRIGVLSETGQTGYSARCMISRWGLEGSAQLMPLGTYPAIYRALASGSVEAGVLTADYRLAGEIAFGFRALADLGQEFGFQGPVVATTRRFKQQHADTVARVVKGYVRAIQLFRQQSDEVVSILRRHLGFVDDPQARAICAFYAERFRSEPFASEAGVQNVIRSLQGDKTGLTAACVLDRATLAAALKV